MVARLIRRKGRRRRRRPARGCRSPYRRPRPSAIGPKCDQAARALRMRARRPPRPHHQPLRLASRRKPAPKDQGGWTGSRLAEPLTRHSPSHRWYFASASGPTLISPRLGSTSFELGMGTVGAAALACASVRECHPSGSTMESGMPKRIVRDYRSMTEQELSATAREAHRREETARHAKARRSWKSVWSAAEEELANRRASARG